MDSNTLDAIRAYNAEHQRVKNAQTIAAIAPSLLREARDRLCRLVLGFGFNDYVCFDAAYFIDRLNEFEPTSGCTTLCPPMWSSPTIVIATDLHPFSCGIILRDSGHVFIVEVSADKNYRNQVLKFEVTAEQAKRYFKKD